MSKPLRVLLVEDSADDAALVLHELKRGGFDVEYKRVDSPTAFLGSIEESPWDVILSDFAMPQFNGMLAFDMTLERGLDIPFIFVSGRIGEDRAADAMRRGAKDYVLKDNLKRLVPAVERELRDAEERRKRRAATHALRESEEKYRTLLESSIQGVGVIRNLNVLFANPAFVDMFGFGSLDALLAEPSIANFIAPEDRPKLEKVYRDRLAGREIPARSEMHALRRDGTAVIVDASLKVVRWEGQDAVLAVLVDVTERRRAEEELRKSEAKFRSLLESSIQGVCVQRDFRLLFANTAFAKLHGYETAEEMQAIGSMIDMIFPEDREALQRQYEARMRGDAAPDRFGMRVRRKDGTVAWFDTSVITVVWEGQPAVLINIVDVTERRRAEEKLRANERLLETVFDTIPLTLAVKDRSSRYVKVNRAWCERYGVTPQDVIGKQTLDTPSRNPAGAKRAFSEDLSVFDGGQALVFDGIEIIRDGRERHFQTTKSPLRDEAGHITGLVGVSVDLTELKRAEEEMRASQRLLRTVFDTLPVHLVVKDAETRYLMVNSAWCERYGMTEADVIGKTTMEIPGRPIQDRELSLIHDQETLASDKKMLVLEGWDTTASGEVRHYQSIRAPLRDESGRVTGLVGATVDLTDLKRAEEKLRANEQLLQTVFDTIPISVRVTDRSGDYLAVNRAWCRFYDLKPEDVAGKNAWKFPARPEAEQSHAIQEDRDVLSGKGSIRVGDVFYTSRRGERLQVRSYKAPLRDEKGEVIGMVGAYMDLTPEKRAQEELRANQRLLRTVFDAIPHHLVVKDRNFHYLMVNKAWCDTYGLAETEVLHKPSPITPQRPEGDVRKIHDLDVAVMTDGGSTRTMERVFVGRDGREHTLQDIRVPFRDEEERVVGLVGIAVDLTEQRAAQRKADLAHARLYDAVESLPAAFFLFDEQERIVLWNSRVREFYRGLYEAMEPGMTLEQSLWHAAPSFQDAQSDRSAWVQGQLALYRRSPAPYEHQLTDGRWVQSLTRRTSDGGMVFLCFDVSDMKQREQELRQAQKMEAVGQLTGGVAHDFNNMLQVISGYIELAKQDVKGNPEASLPLQTAEEACRRAADLTQRLLAFSRKQVLRAQHLDLPAVVQEIAKLLGRLLPGNITLDVKEDEFLEPVVADRGMIEQVLINLAVNARDAMPDGGTIEVKIQSAKFDETFTRSNPWARPGRYTVIRFTDTGLGMSPEVKERIFDPFFTTKGLGKGTGLGLSTVYGIVQQHEGLIQVESRPGAGSTFSIHLPVRGQDPLESEDTEQGALRGGTETVLVAEDEPQVRSLLVQTLRGAGYQVLEAADALDAIGLAARAGMQVGLAILDMTMPKMGGREVHLRILEAQPRLRVLFTSGWFSPEEQRALAKDGLLFLHKPYSREQILRAVRQALDVSLAGSPSSSAEPARKRRSERTTSS